MKRNRAVISGMIISGLLIFFSVQPMDGQNEKGDVLQQYLYPAFSKGVVRVKNGKEANLILNYNMVSEKMVFLQKEKYYDLSNPETVDTVYLNGVKFIPHEKQFVELVVKDKVTLFIQHKADLQAPPRPGAYGTTSELTSSNYLSGVQTDIGYYNFKLPDGYTVKVKPFYWIRIGEDWNLINSEKQVPKLFPGSEDKIRNFIKENKIKSDRRDDMVKLVMFCNTLQK